MISQDELDRFRDNCKKDKMKLSILTVLIDNYQHWFQESRKHLPWPADEEASGKLWDAEVAIRAFQNL